MQGLDSLLSVVSISSGNRDTMNCLKMKLDWSDLAPSPGCNIHSLWFFVEKIASLISINHH